jgi:hypothetical protein
VRVPETTVGAVGPLQMFCLEDTCTHLVATPLETCVFYENVWTEDEDEVQRIFRKYSFSDI